VIPALKYAWLTCKHKLFVFLAGRKLRVGIWQLLVHDLSKFGRHELFQYGRQFFGAKDRPTEFAAAWLHHQNTNPHHWEYWIPRTGHDRGGFPGGQPLEMPEKYAREMVADWLGATRAYEGKWPAAGSWKWYQVGFPKIVLHPSTRVLVDELMRPRSKTL